MSGLYGGADLAPSSFARYMRQVELLAPEEEVQLAKRIEAGLLAEELLQCYVWSDRLREEYEWIAEDGDRAKTCMIEANLRLASGLARRYRWRGLSFGDLVQEANTGLIHAVVKFDYTKGVKFSTHATWWIRKYLSRAVMKQVRTIALPEHMSETLLTLDVKMPDLLITLGREPTLAEKAEAVGVEPEKLQEIFDFKDAMSFEGVFLHDNEDLPLVDSFTYDNDIDPAEYVAGRNYSSWISEVVSDLMSELSKGSDDHRYARNPERELRIVEWLYGFGPEGVLSQTEVGRRLGLDRTRVRQLNGAILKRLRGQLQRYSESDLRMTA